MTKAWLIDVDNAIREAVTKVKTLRRVVQYVQNSFMSQGRNFPNKNLVVRRACRILDTETLLKLSRRSKLIMSVQEFLQYRKETIRQLCNTST